MNLAKRLTALVVAMALCLSLAACNGTAETKKNIASVQSVSMIMGLDIAGVNRFSGVAEANSSQKIEKDSDKTVEELFVEVGQEVKKGDLLFRYDVEAMKLSVESAELELEQMQNQVKSYESQIAQLQKEKKNASKSEQLSYILQIQEAELDQAEAQYNLKQKQIELEKLKKSTENAEVYAEVDGVIQSINDSDSGYGDYSYGENGSAYITIMETGTYRVKGSVSENNVYLLYEGMEVTLQSRTNPEQMWSGVISEVNTGSTEEENNNQGYYDEGGGESASKYSFYVTLEDSEGMMMGQHLYILPYAIDRSNGTGVVIPESYVVQEDGGAYVWAASGKDTLEKRAVALGFYDELMGTYAIEGGLSTEDYIADPAEALTEGQAVAKYDADSYGFSDGSEGEDFTDEEWTDDGAFADGEWSEGMMEGEFIEGEEAFDEGAYGDEGDFTEEEMTEEGFAEEELTEGPVVEG